MSQVIHEAEADLEVAKIDLEKARDLFSSLKLQLRDKQVEGVGKLYAAYNLYMASSYEK